MENNNQELKAFEPVGIEKFGRDHWSLLAFVEDCCVNTQGEFGKLRPRHMNCNPERHPIHPSNGWRDNYSTRLRGLSPDDTLEQSFEKGTRIKGHCDWDCLEDLENAGLIEIISLTTHAVKMTEKGGQIAGQLRHHKSNGGQFAQFVPA